MKIYRFIVAHPIESLAGLWTISFGISALILMAMYLSGIGNLHTVGSGFEAVGSIYSPYLGSILAYYFAKHRPRAPTRQIGGFAKMLAIAGSLLWSVMVWIALIDVFRNATPLLDAAQNAAYISRQLSWALGPIFGFYFANIESAGK